MNKLKNQLCATSAVLAMGVLLAMAESVSASATEKSGYDFPSSGVDAALTLNSSDQNSGSEKSEEIELNINDRFNLEKERMMTELVMANVSNTLNVRAEADEESEKVGYLYKDCGGTILEQKDGWTKIKSGSLMGWCSDEYLAFGDDAIALSEDVGRWMVTLRSEALRVRTEPSMDADVMAVLAKGDYADLVEIVDDDWVSIDYEGELGYVDTKYIDIFLHIDEGETMEKIRTREKIEAQLKAEAEAQAEAERKAAKEKQDAAERNVNRGAVTADADELRLLAALIYCEAGNQPYEGMVAVGAVVMNRVKSPAYPNTIYSVIYASGQFTPAMSGKVANAYVAGVPDLCTMAAIAALNGETTVGGATHFRRNNGREGYVLGAHVFW